MNKATRSLFHLFLGVMTCVLVVFLSTASTFSQQRMPSTQEFHAQTGTTLAQGMSPSMKRRYSVSLGSNNVVAPNAPSTSATGTAEATLMGDRLKVKGSFSNLSSALRDYVTDPVNPPNPKITSAVHIHRGEATENGPFQFALTVKMNDMGMDGKFSGEYTLSPEQLQALADGKLYIDLHTKQNRAGELRGAFRPA
ncbi:MAG: CHRD domain-containing protein [Leptolyngbyaceae cyanobacterium bins.302]|nr:CHRD domain-containing protein [Leptolyngbyaceae cyanobacterium bins.302]